VEAQDRIKARAVFGEEQSMVKMEAGFKEGAEVGEDRERFQ